jgi:hypothetical protein
MKRQNPWFERVGYEPANMTSARPFRRGARTDTTEMGGAPHVSAPFQNDGARVGGTSSTGTAGTRHIFLSNLSNAFGAAVGAAVATAVSAFLFLHFVKPTQIPVPALPDPKIPIISAKLERTSSDAGLQHLIADRAPAAASVASLWNYQAKHRFVFGDPTLAARYLYLPVPRPGWEPFYNGLALPELKLYVIQLSKLLTAHELDDHQYRWAAHCGIEKDWIPYWSSWKESASELHAVKKFKSFIDWPRPPEDRTLVNDCGPGGTCFIISHDCDAEAISDFESVTEKE